MTYLKAHKGEDASLLLARTAALVAITSAIHAVSQAFGQWPIGLLNFHIGSALALVIIAALREHADRIEHHSDQNTRRIQHSVKEDRVENLTGEIADLERRLHRG